MNSFENPNVDVPFQGSPPIDLLVEDLIVGDGAECEAGQIISVDYVGISWSTGIEFDSSWSRNEVFAFSLGGGQVISGWDEGCSGMRIGGRRKLIIPPEKGYGSQGVGGVIAPNETLVFIVDLRSIG